MNHIGSSVGGPDRPDRKSAGPILKKKTKEISVPFLRHHIPASNRSRRPEIHGHDGNSGPMEAVANPSRCGVPLLHTTKDQVHGSAAGASLLHLPGGEAASPSGDSQQQAPDEERTTTVTCGRPELDLSGDDHAPHKVPPCFPQLSPLSFITSFSIPSPIKVSCFDSDQQELSASPDPCTVMTGAARSSPTSWTSSTVRSSAPLTMIHHRIRRSTLSLCFLYFPSD